MKLKAVVEQLSRALWEQGSPGSKSRSTNSDDDGGFSVTPVRGSGGTGRQRVHTGQANAKGTGAIDRSKVVPGLTPSAPPRYRVHFPDPDSPKTSYPEKSDAPSNKRSQLNVKEDTDITSRKDRRITRRH